MIKLSIRPNYSFTDCSPEDEPVSIDWTDGERQAFKPPSKLKVSEWAERHRILQAGVSRLPGPWSNDTMPHAIEVMDAYNDPFIRHIVLCFGTQSSKTETLYNILGYIIDQEPYSTLLVYPREDDCKGVSRARVQPMVNDCPTLAAKKPAKADLFQLLEMHFPGMILYLVGSNSPAGLAQKPCRNVLRDEIDKYPVQIGNDADPLSLSEERTKSYWDIRKIVDVSSPTLEDVGIWKQLQTCDEIREREVLCPNCLKYQFLQFKNIVWDKPEGESGWAEKINLAQNTARYICEHCEAEIVNDERAWMLQNGRWSATKTSDFKPRKVGFRLPSWHSPFLTWGDMAAKFLLAMQAKQEKGDVEPLKNFWNGWGAEPWKQVVVTASESEILKACCDLPQQVVPAEAIVLTAFIDPQISSYWFRVRAHARDFTSWLIHWGSLSTWEDIEDLLFGTSYPVQGTDRSVRIWRAGIDTGGTRKNPKDISMTEEAYFWLRRNMVGRGCRVWGCKGSSNPLSGKLQLGKPLDKTPSGKPLPPAPGVGGLQLVMIDTGKAKDAFHYRLDLARRQEPGGAYLHAGDEKVFRQYLSHVTAEEKRKDKRGIEEWVQIRERNDLLDCESNGLLLVDPEWPGGGLNLVGAATSEASRKSQRRVISRGIGG